MLQSQWVGRSRRPFRPSRSHSTTTLKCGCSAGLHRTMIDLTNLVPGRSLLSSAGAAQCQFALQRTPSVLQMPSGSANLGTHRLSVPSRKAYPAYTTAVLVGHLRMSPYTASTYLRGIPMNATSVCLYSISEQQCMRHVPRRRRLQVFVISSPTYT